MATGTIDAAPMRALAAVVGVVVVKDLLAFEVFGALLGPPGWFRMPLVPLPQLPLDLGFWWFTRLLMLIAFVAALGLARGARAGAWVLLALYGWVFLNHAPDYTSNVFLLLILLAALGCTPLRGMTPAWPCWLVRITMTAVYLGAATAKVDPLWLSGRVLRESLFHYGGGFYARAIGWDAPALFAALACVSLLVEASLAVGLWIPRLRRPVAALGVAFHLGIELLLPVRLFSYLAPAGYLAFFSPQALAPVLDRWERWTLRWWWAPAVVGVGAVVNLHHYGNGDQNVVLAVLAAFLVTVMGLLRRRSRVVLQLVPGSSVAARVDASLDAATSTAAGANVERHRIGVAILLVYAAFQIACVAKPALGHSQRYAWRMFSEILKMNVTAFRRPSPGAPFEPVVIEATQRRWTDRGLRHHFTSLSEEEIYLQGFANWLVREGAAEARVVARIENNGRPEITRVFTASEKVR